MNYDTLSARITSSDFPAEELQIHRIEGQEAISRPFRFEIELVAPAMLELAADEVAGALASLVFELEGEVVRTIHGMISELEDLLDVSGDHRSYRVVLVPRMHMLTLVEIQEVFLEQSVPSIIKQKLDLVGVGEADVEMRLQNRYDPRELVIEYKETDLAFVSRLTEHLGVSFFFDHRGDTDKIVFTDHAGGFMSLPEHDKVPFEARRDHQGVYAIRHVTRVSPRRFYQQDYNYRTPRLDLTASHAVESGLAGGVVEFGSHVKTPAEARMIAQIRAEERDATHRFYAGESAVVSFTAGARVTLDDHPRVKERLLLVEVTHHFTQQVGTHGKGSGGDGYRNSFRATPASRTYRPARVTPKPRIAGVVTAVIEPVPGGQVAKHANIDDQGRYTVRFAFDSAPASPLGRSSRPIRMIQPHAGPGYGVHFPLHSGVEVAIVFVDGDPDRPLIQGAIPNPATPTPVQRQNSLESRIQTSSGLHIVMKDA